MVRRTSDSYIENRPGQSGSAIADLAHLFRLILFAMLSAIVPILAARADELTLKSAGAVGGSGTDGMSAVAKDSAGNLYLAGHFESSADLNPGVGVLTVNSVGRNDIFVCKLDSGGNLLWIRSAGGGGTTQSAPHSIAVDIAGNVHIVGLFEGTVDFDPGPGTYDLVSAGVEDCFIWKLDSSGSFLWAKRIGGSSTDEAYSIATDAVGNVYACGFFYDTVDFDPGPGTFNLTSAGDNDTYIIKLDASGDFQWVRSLGGIGSDDRFVELVSDEQGNLFLTGGFRGTLDFDPGPGNFALTAVGGIDIFVWNMNSSGELLWAKSMGGFSADRGYGIALDSQNNVYLTGIFHQTVDFDPGPGTYELTGSNTSSVFTCKLDGTGNFLWAREIGAQSTTTHITVDISGDLYYTGVFLGTVDFDPGADTYTITANGSYQVFVSKLDGEGNFRWAGQLGGSATDLSTDILVDFTGNTYVTGVFGDTADFDPGAGVYNLSSAGSSDGFMVELDTLAPSATNDYGATSADQTLMLLSSPLSTTILMNDTGFALRVIAHDATSALGAAVVVNPDGTFVYDPTAVAVFQALAPGNSLVDTFTYTLSDGTDIAVGTVTITVYGKGTALPAMAVWGLGLLCLGLAGVGIRARRPSR